MSNQALASNNYKESIKKVLSQCVQQKTKITMWKIAFDKKLSVQLKIHFVSDTNQTIQFKVDEKDKDIIKELINGDKFAKFLIEESNTLFQCEVRSYNHPDFTVLLPKMIAIQNRRKDLRLNVTTENYKIIIQLNSKHHQKVIFNDRLLYDISKGGLSLMLNMQEKKILESNKDMLVAILALEHRLIPVSINLVNMIEIEPNDTNKLLYKSYKACFQFRDLEAKSSELINNCIMNALKLEAS
jgi:hypothetical protein